MKYSYDHIPKNHFEALSMHRADEVKGLLRVTLRVLRKIQLPERSVASIKEPAYLPVRKDEIVNLIVKLLSPDEVLRALYEQFNDIEKSAVRESVHDPHGRLETEKFKAKYGKAPRLKIDYNTKIDALSPLCLLMPYNNTITPDLIKRLSGFIPRPVRASVQYEDEIPQEAENLESEAGLSVIHSAEQAALHDVGAILQLIDNGKINVGDNTGYVTLKSAKVIRSILLDGDFYPEGTEAGDKYDVQMGPLGIRPFAWPLIMQAGKLAKAEGGKLILTRNGKKALDVPSHEILKELWKEWIDNTIMHEMRRIEIIKGQKSKGRPLTQAAPCRAAIGNALSELPEGKWVDIDDFFKFLIASGNGFEVARNPWYLYIEDSQYGSLGYSHTKWEHANGRFARAFLLEYAATMGLIDVSLVPPWEATDDFRELWGMDNYSCMSRYDGLEYIRLTPLGSWILGAKNTYESESLKTRRLFKILPNLEITILAPAISPSDKLSIERFCEQKSERVWSLSRDKILKSVENGIKMPAIREFLDSQNDGDIPQLVEVFLSDIEKKIDKIRYLGNCSLLQCEDEYTAILLSNYNRLKKICFRAEDCYLIVREGKENEFRRIARESGYVVPSLKIKTG